LSSLSPSGQSLRNKIFPISPKMFFGTVIVAVLISTVTAGVPNYKLCMNFHLWFHSDLILSLSNISQVMLTSNLNWNHSSCRLVIRLNYALCTENKMKLSPLNSVIYHKNIWNSISDLYVQEVIRRCGSSHKFLSL